MPGLVLVRIQLEVQMTGLPKGIRRSAGMNLAQ